MGNDSWKKRIQDNRKIFKTWAAFSTILTSIAATLIFIVRKDEPERQNIKTFIFSLIITSTCLYFLLKYAGTVRDETKQGIVYKPRGDLRGKHAAIVDLMGISAIVSLIGVWWSKACIIYIIIPIYVVKHYIGMVLSWLRYK